MQKQKSSGMRLDEDYASATKQLIKKTLIGLGLTTLLLLIFAFWLFKKVTTPEKEIAQESASPSSTEQVLSATIEPTVSPTLSPSPTVSLSPTPSATPTLSPSPSSSPTPSIKPSASATSTPAPAASNAKTISSQSNLDGYQSSNGSGSATAEIKVGRNSAMISRGFLSFDITQLNSNQTDKVVLRIFQQSTTGTPYVSGGDLKIDHLNYGSTFENGDYSTSSISSSFSTISNSSASGWKEIEVTQNVKGDLAAGRPRSQFRLHFAVEQMGGNATGDFALFESGDNALKTGNIPQLMVTTH